MRYAHDLVNVSLDKPMHAPEAVGQWEPYARKLAAQVAGVHQGQRRPPKCRFDTATFSTNPLAVSRFMKDLRAAERAGDAETFVHELNTLCSTQQLPLRQDDPDPVKISGKCSGLECSLTATAGGRTLEKQPKIKIPITAVTHEGVRRAVKSAREQLREAMGERVPSVKRAKKVRSLPKKTDGKPTRRDTFAQLDGQRIDLELQVVPLPAVIASNDPLTFETNPDYPGWLQPRDRTRAANVVQVRTMAGALDPERLVEDFHTLEGGPPVVWRTREGEGAWKYMVVSGNGRAMAIQLAEAQHPELYAAYIAALEEKFPVQIKSRLGPRMLVRVLNPGGELNPSKERVREIAELGNVAKAAATSSVEQAAIDTTVMTGEFIGRLSPLEDESATLAGTVRAAKNRAWTTEFLGMIPQTQLAELVGPDGSLNNTGIERAVMALTMWTFGVEDNGRRLAEFAFESLEGDAKNVMQGTLRAVPRLASMRAQLQGYVTNAGPETMRDAVVMQDAYDLTPTVADAILRYIKIKAASQPVEDALSQASFDAPISPASRTLIRMFESNKRSARAIGELFNAYASEVQAMPNPSQASMLGSPSARALTVNAGVDLIRQLVAQPATPAGHGQMMELSKRLTARARDNVPRRSSSERARGAMLRAMKAMRVSEVIEL